MPSGSDDDESDGQSHIDEEDFDALRTLANQAILSGNFAEAEGLVNQVKAASINGTVYRRTLLNSVIDNYQSQLNESYTVWAGLCAKLRNVEERHRVELAEKDKIIDQLTAQLQRKDTKIDWLQNELMRLANLAAGEVTARAKQQTTAPITNISTPSKTSEDVSTTTSVEEIPPVPTRRQKQFAKVDNEDTEDESDNSTSENEPNMYDQDDNDANDYDSDNDSEEDENEDEESNDDDDEEEEEEEEDDDDGLSNVHSPSTKLRSLCVIATPKNTPPPAIPRRRTRPKQTSQPTATTTTTSTIPSASDGSSVNNDAIAVSLAIKTMLRQFEPFTDVCGRLIRHEARGATATKLQVPAAQEICNQHIQFVKDFKQVSEFSDLLTVGQISKYRNTSIFSYFGFLTSVVIIHSSYATQISPFIRRLEL